MQKCIEIDPVSKLNEITALLAGHSPEVHTNEESEYEDLEDGCFCVTAENNSGERLYIDLTEEFTLTFAAWHTHYSADDAGYDGCRSDIISILNNEKYVFVVESGGRWMGSSLESRDISKESAGKKILNDLGYNAFIKEVRENGAVMHFRFWDASSNRALSFMPNEI